MPFKGHITLDGKDYVLRNLPTKTFVNQMAPAIGQGESKYADGTSWAAWIQKDWQDGNGRLDPLESGGFLYGEVDSRVPKQLILPQKLAITGTLTDSETPLRYNPDDVQASIRVGSGGYARFAQQITTSANPHLVIMYMLFRFPKDMSLSISVWSNSGGLPSVETAPNVYTQVVLESLPGYHWYPIYASFGGAFPATYWIDIHPTSASDYFEIAATTDLSSLDPTSATYNGSTWSTGGVGAYDFPVFALNQAGSIPNTGGGVFFFRFNNNLYLCSSPIVYKWDAVNLEWDVVLTLSDNAAATYANVTSAVVFDGFVYFSQSGGSGHCRMNTSEVLSKSSKTVTLFFESRGYLYAANGNTVEYSDDATTWEPTATFGAPITVGPPDFDITGMGEAGGEVFAATPVGLYKITDGDFAIPVTKWGGVDLNNGRSIVEHQGSLYITVNGRVFRYSTDGRVQDVWLTREDDFLASTVGAAVSLTSMNNWLVAICDIPTNGLTPNINTGVGVGYPTIWAMQGNSWHQLAILPEAQGYYVATSSAPRMDVFYDRLTTKLWSYGGFSGFSMVYSQRIPDYTLNPYSDSQSVYAHSAWVEWDWFDGNIFEVYKDYESVTIIGENFSSNCYAEVYWKDDASTQWEYLGTASSNVSTLRWDIDRGDRPATRRFKLGINLMTKDGSETPRIRAIRVKYMPMLRDWYQWGLQIDVAGTAANPQEGVEGHVNTRTAATIHDDLETIAKSTGIFLYTDIDGTQYEVKVRQGSFPYSKFEYNENAAANEWEGVWNLTIEQTNPDPYA